MACLLVFNCLSLVLAQQGGIANNWFFGKLAGVNFSSGNPVAISGPINTYEGVSVVSNLAGSLLFSTDGIRVFNKNNLQMPNGNGLFGNPSSTQSGVIVPNPASSTQYYIFTTTDVGGFNGVRYSTVDMTLAGGLGDVVTKNIPLLTPSTEKLTAVKHCNNVDYWVLCHEWESDAFYAYQVTSAGISAPVISHVGSIHQNTNSSLGPGTETIGYLKTSPDAKKIAVALYGMENASVEIFDFDNATGIISNPTYIPSGGGAYGVSFSPDNSKLYVTFADSIMQYDLSVSPLKSYLVNYDPNNFAGALQLGPDRKIYVAFAFTAYLGVINKPNELGTACDFVQQAVDLSPDSSTYGLPNFPDNLFLPAFNLGEDFTLCSDTATLKAGTDWLSYTWSTGASTPEIKITQAGTYWAVVVDKCGNIFLDSIKVAPPPQNSLNLGNDTLLCNGTPLTLSGGSGGTAYIWSNNASTQNITVNTSGTYWLKKFFACGSATDSIHVTISPPLNLSVNAPASACSEGLLTLSATASGGFGNLLFSLNGNPYQAQNIFQVNAGNYSVTVKDQNNCTNTKTVSIESSQPIHIQLFNIDSAYCNKKNGKAAALATGGNGNFSYTWFSSPLQHNDTLFNAKKGTYQLRVKDSKGCIKDTFLAIPQKSLPIADFSSFPENNFRFIYEKDTLQFISTSQNAFAYSWDFQDGTFANGQNVAHFFSNLGEYEVTLTAFGQNGECFDKASKKYNIQSRCSHFYAPTSFSPNGDTHNDIFYFVGEMKEFRAIIFDKWGREVFQFHSLHDVWDGTDAPEGVYVYILEAVCPEGTKMKWGGTVTLWK